MEKAFENTVKAIAARKGWRAQTAFDQAIKVARDQSALSLELRAANSCAKLLATRGERRKAHDLLAPIYNRLTEGFGTHDVKRAKALLAELRA